MAKVKFLKGLAEEYTALTTKDSNTFYHTTDDNQVYIGEIKLSSEEDLQKAIDDIKTNSDKLTLLEGEIGDLGNLTTTAKTDLVSAIEELKIAITANKITIESINTTPGAAKSYTVKQGEEVIGVIDIPKDMVVTSGKVITITDETSNNQGTEGDSEASTGQESPDESAGGVEEDINESSGETVEEIPVTENNPLETLAPGTYIELTLANATQDKIYINVGDLVDIYKEKQNASQVQITVDQNTREISAVIVAGSITSTELADSAVITSKISDGNVTKAKLAEEVIASLNKADAAEESLTWGTIADITVEP